MYYLQLYSYTQSFLRNQSQFPKTLQMRDGNGLRYIIMCLLLSLCHLTMILHTYIYIYIKNCLGALDGTHIRVKIPLDDKPRYRKRKEEITTNILGVCSQDMHFIYILASWEDSVADSIVLRDAISRRNGMIVPHGKENTFANFIILIIIRCTKAFFFLFKKKNIYRLLLSC
jgi:hypothetical protein